MGFMDKVKSQATTLAKTGQAKLDSAQAKRHADAMFRDLGALYYADRVGRGTPEGPQQVEEIIGRLQAHEAEHGPIAIGIEAQENQAAQPIPQGAVAGDAGQAGMMPQAAPSYQAAPMPQGAPMMPQAAPMMPQAAPMPDAGGGMPQPAAFPQAGAMPQAAPMPEAAPPVGGSFIPPAAAPAPAEAPPEEPPAE